MRKYKNTISDYPMQAGNIYESNGSSILCADLINDVEMVEQYIVAHQPIKMVYFGPPYNIGTVNSYMSKAKLPHVSLSYESWFRKVLERINGLVNVPVFVEIGAQKRDTVIAELEDIGFRVVNAIPITYYKKNACFLIAAIKGNGKVNFVGLHGKDDEDTPKIALLNNTKIGDTVLDVCAGIGTTAFHALSNGRKFIGVEINPARASHTAKVIADGAQHISMI